MPAAIARCGLSTQLRLLAGFLLVLSFLPAAPASAGPVAVAETFTWAGSPAFGPDGQPLPAAVTYEVWVAVEAQPATLAAVVPDTSWILSAEPGVAYALRVRGVSATGQRSPFSPWSATYRFGSATGVPEATPSALGPAAPNPFNGRTAITCRLPDDLSTSPRPSLELYDLRGRLIRSWVLSAQQGEQSVVWDGTDGGGSPVPAGTYLARMNGGPLREVLKISLVK